MGKKIADKGGCQILGECSYFSLQQTANAAQNFPVKLPELIV